MKIFQILIPLMLAIWGCSGSTDQQSGESHAEDHQDHHPNRIELTPAQFQNAAIRLDTLHQSYVPQTVKANGHITLPPNKHATVAPVIGGSISEIHVLPGDKVDKGSILATLQNPEFIQLQEDYLANREMLSYWEKSLERQNRLFEDSIGAAKDLQEVASNYASLKARVASQSRKLALLGLSTENLNANNIRTYFYLRSPIEGEVQHIQARMGQYAQSDQPVFEIVDREHVHLDLKVYEDNANKVRKNQSVFFRFQQPGNNPWRKAHIFGVGSMLDEDSKARDVHAHIDKIDSDLLPGMYVEARIMVDSVFQNVIPEQGVVNDSEGFSVFKMIAEPNESNDHYQFQKMMVNRSLVHEGNVGINGLSDEERKGRFAIEGADVLLREYAKGELGGH